MPHRTRGRRVPPRQPALHEPPRNPPPTADAEELALTMLLAAQHYLTQRQRYLDVSAVTRIALGPQPGTVTFWMDLMAHQPPLDLVADYADPVDPNAFAARKLVLLNDGRPDPAFEMVAAFAETATDAEAELHQKIVDRVLAEIGLDGMASIIGQWNAAGPWAWLDPLLTPDQPIRAWNGAGPGEPLDLHALYRTVHGDDPTV